MRRIVYLCAACLSNPPANLFMRDVQGIKGQGLLLAPRQCTGRIHGTPRSLCRHWRTTKRTRLRLRLFQCSCRPRSKISTTVRGHKMDSCSVHSLHSWGRHPLISAALAKGQRRMRRLVGRLFVGIQTILWNSSMLRIRGSALASPAATFTILSAAAST